MYNDRQGVLGPPSKAQVAVKMAVDMPGNWAHLDSSETLVPRDGYEVHMTSWQLKITVTPSKNYKVGPYY